MPDSSGTLQLEQLEVTVKDFQGDQSLLEQRLYAFLAPASAVCRLQGLRGGWSLYTSSMELCHHHAQHHCTCRDGYLKSLTTLQQNSGDADVHIPQEVVQYACQPLACLLGTAPVPQRLMPTWPPGVWTKEGTQTRGPQKPFVA